MRHKMIPLLIQYQRVKLKGDENIIYPSFHLFKAEFLLLSTLSVDLGKNYSQPMFLPQNSHMKVHINQHFTYIII